MYHSRCLSSVSSAVPKDVEQDTYHDVWESSQSPPSPPSPASDRPDLIECLENFLEPENPLIAEHLHHLGLHYNLRRPSRRISYCNRNCRTGHRYCKERRSDLSSALRCHHEALSILRWNRSRALLFDDPESARHFAVDAAIVLSDVGSALREIGDTNGAAAAYLECMERFLDGSTMKSTTTTVGGSVSADERCGDGNVLDDDCLALNPGFRSAVRGASILLRQMRYAAQAAFLLNAEVEVVDEEESDEVSLLSQEGIQDDSRLASIPIVGATFDDREEEVCVAVWEELQEDESDGDDEDENSYLFERSFPGHCISFASALTFTSGYSDTESCSSYHSHHSCPCPSFIETEGRRRKPDPLLGILPCQSVASEDNNKYGHPDFAEMSPSPLLMPLEELLQDVICRFTVTASLSMEHEEQHQITDSIKLFASKETPVALVFKSGREDYPLGNASEKYKPCPPPKNQSCYDNEDRTETRGAARSRRFDFCDTDSYRSIYKTGDFDCDGRDSDDDCGGNSFSSPTIQDRFKNFKSDILSEEGTPNLLLTPTGDDDDSETDGESYNYTNHGHQEEEERESVMKGVLNWMAGLPSLPSYQHSLNNEDGPARLLPNRTGAR